MKIFCPSCGQANEYSGVKPNFCGFCAEALSLQASGSVSQPLRPIARRPAGRSMTVAAKKRGTAIDAFEEEYEAAGNMLPDIDKLDVEIEVSKPYREKVGDVWGSGGTGDLRRAPEKINKKKALANFTDRIFKKSLIDLNPNHDE